MMTGLPQEVGYDEKRGEQEDCEQTTEYGDGDGHENPQHETQKDAMPQVHDIELKGIVVHADYR